MTTFSKFSACLLIFVLSSGAQAKRFPVFQPFPFDKLMLDEFLEQVQGSGHSLYVGPTVDCTLGTTCSVTITPLELFDGSGKMVACASQVGQIRIALGSNPKPGTLTKIVWTIGPIAIPHAPPTNATYSFKPPLGLIVLKDDAHETKGKTDSVTTTEVVLSYKYKAHGAHVNPDVVYYPLVFQDVPVTDPPTEPALCGSADPKIVNN